MSSATVAVFLFQSTISALILILIPVAILWILKLSLPPCVSSDLADDVKELQLKVYSDDDSFRKRYIQSTAGSSPTIEVTLCYNDHTIHHVTMITQYIMLQWSHNTLCYNDHTIHHVTIITQYIMLQWSHNTSCYNDHTIHHVTMITQYIMLQWSHNTSCYNDHTIHHVTMITQYIMLQWSHNTSCYNDHTIHHVTMITQYIMLQWSHNTSCYNDGGWSTQFMPIPHSNLKIGIGINWVKLAPTGFFLTEFNTINRCLHWLHQWCFTATPLI